MQGACTSRLRARIIERTSPTPGGVRSEGRDQTSSALQTGVERGAGRIRDEWGITGWARAFEATHGREAGWHPHFHIVLVLDGKQDRAAFEAVGEQLWPLWERALHKRGLSALRGPGLDIRTNADEVAEGLSRYLTKQMAMEATHGHAKQGRAGGRTPFQILNDVVTTGDADDLDLWHEWEQASHGRRQLTWS